MPRPILFFWIKCLNKQGAFVYSNVFVCLNESPCSRGNIQYCIWPAFSLCQSNWFLAECRAYVWGNCISEEDHKVTLQQTGRRGNKGKICSQYTLLFGPMGRGRLAYRMELNYCQQWIRNSCYHSTKEGLRDNLFQEASGDMYCCLRPRYWFIWKHESHIYYSIELGREEDQKLLHI